MATNLGHYLEASYVVVEYRWESSLGALRRRFVLSGKNVDVQLFWSIMGEVVFSGRKRRRTTGLVALSILGRSENCCLTVLLLAFMR